MSDLAVRAQRFRALHERPEPLLMPNPWDAGSARLLAGLGFDALATTSLGAANVTGRRRARARRSSRTAPRSAPPPSCP